MKFTWFITDVDGTLLDDDGNLPEANRDALKHCRNLGVPVVLATGRRWTTLQRLINRLELEGLADFAILNNGMVIKELKTRTVLHRETFALGVVLDVVEALAALDLDPIALAYDPQGGPDVFHRRFSLMNGDFVSKNAADSVGIQNYRELEEKHVVELILLGAEPELTLAQKSIAHLPLESALIRNTFYSGYMLEITPRFISKFSGAQRVAEILGFTLAEAVAVGDSANDLPLLLRVGKSIAVGSAPDDVRNAVHEVVASGGEAGVSEAIFRHFPG